VEQQKEIKTLFYYSKWCTLL